MPALRRFGGGLDISWLQLLKSAARFYGGITFNTGMWRRFFQHNIIIFECLNNGSFMPVYYGLHGITFFLVKLQPFLDCKV